MHVSFKIHYRNNLIDKKDSYLISCPPSWDDRNYSYGHQLYPSEHVHLQRESQSHAPAHVLMRLNTQSINRSFVYKAKEGRHVRI